MIINKNSSLKECNEYYSKMDSILMPDAICLMLKRNPSDLKEVSNSVEYEILIDAFYMARLSKTLMPIQASPETYTHEFCDEDGYPIFLYNTKEVRLWAEEKGYILFSEDEVINISNDYKSPYIALMERCIKENNLSDNNQLKKEILIDWFLNNLSSIDPVPSRNKADMLATFVRKPESQKGGLTAFKKKG